MMGSVIFTYVDAKQRRRLTLDVYRPEKPQGLRPAIVISHGIAHEFVMMPGAPHPFWGSVEWFELTVQAVDAYLRQCLK